MASGQNFASSTVFDGEGEALVGVWVGVEVGLGVVVALALGVELTVGGAVTVPPPLQPVKRRTPATTPNLMAFFFTVILASRYAVQKDAATVARTAYGHLLGARSPQAVIANLDAARRGQLDAAPASRISR